jgi:isochorismate synthase
MIDWQRVAALLAELAATAQPARLLSIALPLPHRPAAGLPTPTVDDWCFWQRPDRGLRLLGFGKAVAATSAGAGRFAALHATQRGLADGWRYNAAPAPLAFAGFAFMPHGGGPLPSAALWVPELLLREQDAQVWLTLSCAASDAGTAPQRWFALWQAAQQAAHAAVPPAPTLLPPHVRKTGSLPPTGRASAWGGPAPTFTAQPNPLADAAFLARGRAALQAIAAGRADKLVLTRSIRLKAAAGIAMQPLLDTLAARHPACATFGVGHAGKSFVGASPETLLALNGAQVAVDALAGTAWQASTLALGADKNRREHEFVAHAVAAALAGACSNIAVPDAPEIMRLNAHSIQLSHLRRRITAQRPLDVSAFDLIARLHPTPAVGGAPTTAALDWLAQHGDRRDAWYTGGIGWIDAAGDCDIAVALRCGLLEGNEATLYAGAGFVAGSDPEQELAETEAKFAAMREALTADAGRERDAA